MSDRASGPPTSGQSRSAGTGKQLARLPEPRGEPKGPAAPPVLSTQPGGARRLRTPRCPAPLRGAWVRVGGEPHLTRPATVTGPAPRPTPARAAHPPAAHLLGVRVRSQARLQLLHNLERRLRRHRCHWRGLLAGTGLASRPRAATPPSVRPRRRRKREWSLPGLRWGACGDGLRTRPRARPRPQHHHDLHSTGHAPDTPIPGPCNRHAPKSLCLLKGTVICKPNSGFTPMHYPPSHTLIYT